MIVIADPIVHQAKEDLYIAVRDAERRVLSNDLLKTLPYPPESYSLYEEWKTRARSAERFIQHIRSKKCNILDLGCGNGWMTNMLSDNGHNVIGVDLNFTELQQAELVFGTHQNLKWAYADIFVDEITEPPFDVVLLAASCQYFPDIYKLTERLKGMLNDSGSIHLLDSFFYTDDELESAKKRTRDYYASLGHAEMAEYYYHHSISDLKSLGYRKKFPGLLNRKKLPEWWVLKT